MFDMPHMPVSTLRSRAIATLAIYPQTPPFILHPPADATPRALQTALRHPYCARNEGPVLIHRTPEGITVYPNPEFDGTPPPIPTETATPPARLLPLTPTELSTHFQPAARTTPPPPTPPTGGGAGSEALTRIQALQTPAYRGLSGVITSAQGSTTHYRRLFPEGEFRYVAPDPNQNEPGGLYCRFPARPGDAATPHPDTADRPEFLREPPPARKPGRRRNENGVPGPPVLSTPKDGCFHVFLRRDVTADDIPRFLTELAYRTGDLSPNRAQRVPWDYCASPQDRYIPVPIQGHRADYFLPGTEDRILTFLATDAAYIVASDPAEVYPVIRQASERRGRRIPVRAPRPQTNA